MTPANIDNLTKQADAICRTGACRCKYEFDRINGFRWNFYRRGRFVGGTSDSSAVIRRAEKLVAVK